MRECTRQVLYLFTTCQGQWWVGGSVSLAGVGAELGKKVKHCIQETCKFNLFVKTDVKENRSLGWGQFPPNNWRDVWRGKGMIQEGFTLL